MAFAEFGLEAGAKGGWPPPLVEEPAGSSQRLDEFGIRAPGEEVAAFRFERFGELVRPCRALSRMPPSARAAEAGGVAAAPAGEGALAETAAHVGAALLGRRSAGSGSASTQPPFSREGGTAWAFYALP